MVAQAIELCPEVPLFMIQIGTERLEELFVFVSYRRNCNISELCDRFTAAYQMMGVWEKNLAWRRASKHLTGTNTSVGGVSILDWWVGAAREQWKLLTKHTSYEEVTARTFRSLAKDGVTVFKPLRVWTLNLLGDGGSE